jgi:uncharacterized membrane protein
MEALLFHPKIVHIPIALGMLMPLIAVGSLVAWWKEWLPARSWILVIVLQAALVGAGIVALQTGEAEEERVEVVVSEQFIEPHEEAAEAFVWAAGGVLGIMLLALALSRGRAGLAVAAAATMGTLVVFGFGYRTGEAGGDLVYRHGAAQAYANGGVPSSAAETGNIEHIDDDEEDHD